MSATLTELSNEAEQYAAHGRWGYYRNVRSETADHEHQKGNWKRAGFLYMEVMIFDLQGVASMAGPDGRDGFLQAYRSSTPAVARRVARFSLRADMGEDELRTVYERVTDQYWQDDFPRSRTEVWDEMRTIIWEHRQEIQLQKRVEALGSDQLLTEEEARAYVRLKDDYELVQRVEQILEVENAANIPRTKQERAQLYLSSVNVDRLSDRWKAKALRRSGEVLLSQNKKRKAVQRFERAVDVAGVEEKQVVRRMLRILRESER